jgi:GntR family transcriptional repressor for pyruvate dehydrogenase complex
MSVPSSIGRPGGSLVQRAMESVTAHIRSNDLRVGDTLPGEAHFAGELGVSRAVMREAFGALAALRVIDVANGRKPRVGAMDGSVIAASLDHAVSTAQVTVPHVWEVRRTIEPLAEKMAETVDDLEVMSRHDIGFHEAIARASHNPLFVQIVASFGPLLEVAVPTAWRTRTAIIQRQTMIERHRAVARAIRRRDPVIAAMAMGDHFDASVGDLLKAEANAR